MQGHGVDEAEALEILLARSAAESMVDDCLEVIELVSSSESEDESEGDSDIVDLTGDDAEMVGSTTITIRPSASATVQPDLTFFHGMTSAQIESTMHQYASDCGVHDKRIDFEHMYALMFEEVSDEDGCRPDGQAWPEMGSDAQGDGSLASYVVQAIEDMLCSQSEEHGCGPVNAGPPVIETPLICDGMPAKWLLGRVILLDGEAQAAAHVRAMRHARDVALRAKEDEQDRLWHASHPSLPLSAFVGCVGYKEARLKQQVEILYRRVCVRSATNLSKCVLGESIGRCVTCGKQSSVQPCPALILKTVSGMTFYDACGGEIALNERMLAIRACAEGRCAAQADQLNPDVAEYVSMWPEKDTSQPFQLVQQKTGLVKSYPTLWFREACTVCEPGLDKVAMTLSEDSEESESSDDDQGAACAAAQGGPPESVCQSIKRARECESDAEALQREIKRLRILHEALLRKERMKHYKAPRKQLVKRAAMSTPRNRKRKRERSYDLDAMAQIWDKRTKKCVPGKLPNRRNYEKWLKSSRGEETGGAANLILIRSAEHLKELRAGF